MFLFLKKKKDIPESTEIAALNKAQAFADFIPYSCHYNPHTILTKNGELLQIIKVSANNRGLNYESGASAEATVRENIRKAINEVIQTDDYSLWIHTMRKRKPISFDSEFNEPFALFVNQKWQQKHKWKHQFYNEIYVSVLHEGQSTEMLNTKGLKHVVLPKTNRAHRNRFLEETSAALDSTVSAILEKMRQYYNAQRLSVVEKVPEGASLHQAVFYSEPMEFLGTLLNLRTEPFLLTDSDFSSSLITASPTFGFNALETKNIGGKRRFGAILTLKHFLEVPPETADRVLQAPIELIVSQSYNFVSHQKALKEYKEQKALLATSGDMYCVKVSGLDEMLRSNKDRPTDFGEHQTSIMVLSDEYRDLDSEVQKVQQGFAELGLITIREDIKLEECFWSQMPGNFEFIRRKDVINTGKIAGLCRLNRFPNGKNKDAHWGEAVALIPTVVNSPYFFNFHKEDNGHTAFFDYNSFNDHTGYALLNFLLTEARKYNGRLYIFDRDRSADLYFDKLGGNYHILPPAPDQNSVLKLNPFTLEDNKRNKSFLLAWCGTLLAPANLPEAQKETLRSAIDTLYMQDVSQRHLDGLLAIVQQSDPALAAAFAPWHGRGKSAGLLDAHEENLDLQQNMHAFDMDYVAKHKECTIPVFSYLLHRIITELNGRPTVIVLHEAWDLLENSFFAPRLESLMEMLKQHNAMIIFTTKTPNNHNDTHTLKTIMAQCATCLYIPDDIDLDYESAALGLTKQEEALLLRMDRQKGNFLVRQHGENITLRVSFDGMDDIKSIFSNDVKNLMAAGGKFAVLPQAR